MNRYVNSHVIYKDVNDSRSDLKERIDLKINSPSNYLIGEPHLTKTS